MSYPKIWFLRHGQTEWNAVRRIQGQLESRLSEQGRWHASEQARIMAPILHAHSPKCIASPLIRAFDTATIALGDTPFETDPDLMEIHAGDWQGLFYDDVLAGWPDVVNADMTALELFEHAPAGEGAAAFRARIQSVLDRLSEPTVIVAHGLWGQVARAILRGISDAEMRRLDNLQGVVYVLEGGKETVLRAPL